jgi:hypothetical protein
VAVVSPELDIVRGIVGGPWTGIDREGGREFKSGAIGSCGVFYRLGWVGERVKDIRIPAGNFCVKEGINRRYCDRRSSRSRSRWRMMIQVLERSCKQVFAFTTVLT